MRVFYMTTVKRAEVILRERRIRLSRFGESNDPFEHLIIDVHSPETALAVEKMGDHFNKNIGMICFGTKWSSPVMWAHYAEKYNGVALGFDLSDEFLKKVAYVDKKIRVECASKG